MAFCVSFLCGASQRSGKLACTKPTGMTRASENLAPAVALSRALYSALGLEPMFNGVATAFPEMSLLKFSEDGSITPGLLGLQMPTSEKSDKVLL